MLALRSSQLLSVIQRWHGTDASTSRAHKRCRGSLRGLEIPQLAEV
jgi:hypothetical protein